MGRTPSTRWNLSLLCSGSERLVVHIQRKLSHLVEAAAFEKLKAQRVARSARDRSPSQQHRRKLDVPHPAGLAASASSPSSSASASAASSTSTRCVELLTLGSGAH